MNWIIASLLMFVFSIITYVGTRKATLLSIPTVVINFSHFFFPLLTYVTISFFSRTTLVYSLPVTIILIITAFFFSYLGSLFSIKSIELSPNPGYPLIISKSYVIFTSIVAVFAFQSPLTVKSIIAILLIVLFSSLIMKGKKIHSQGNTHLWLLYALGSFFCWGMLSLATKYLLILGVPIIGRLIYIMFLVVIFQLIEFKVTKVKTRNLHILELLLLTVIGLGSAGFNYFMIVGIDLAPNVGFVNAINASSISAVTICSAILFKDDFSIQKMIGVLGVTGGLLLLIIG